MQQIAKRIQILHFFEKIAKIANGQGRSLHAKRSLYSSIFVINLDLQLLRAVPEPPFGQPGASRAVRVRRRGARDGEDMTRCEGQPGAGSTHSHHPQTAESSS